MPLSKIGIHELEPVPDHLLVRLQPQVLVTVQQCNHPDNIDKGQARVRYLMALLPNTKIGVRWFCGEKGDNQQSSRMTPEEYARDYFHLHIHGTLLMPDNEASSSETDPNVFRHTVAFWTRLTELSYDPVMAARLGYQPNVQLGLGCSPTGNPGNYAQYALLEPYYRAIAKKAQITGIVDWQRPNAYFEPADPGRLVHHVFRHQREGRKVCAEADPPIPLPPFFLGELAPIGDYDDAEYGPRKLGLSGGQTAQLCIDLRLDVPAAYYAAGKGVQGTGVDTWKFFDALHNVDGSDETSWFDVMAANGARVRDDENRRLEAAYLQAVRSTPVVTVPVPITGGVRAKLTKIPASAGGSVNIRETPNGRDIGDRNLQLSEEVTYYPEVASTDGWVYVVCDDGAKGWVSLQNGNVQFTEIQVPVPNPTPAPEFPDNITEADNLRLIFKSIEVAADQLKASATQAQEWLEGWMDRAGDTD